ncbi:hypothetical protein SAMN06265222_101809 [Neorhodopirellula lusitana]|uniref:Uncharacterized protein n=1 Tax=Neorhodopirellula lusitana TaxID=445327 RepID=A0ABY1PQH4_9BACT|nr:hypothetical protein SAMN06265222_101809 [Neorhodopirellula lusitana]
MHFGDKPESQTTEPTSLQMPMLSYCCRFPCQTTGMAPPL